MPSRRMCVATDRAGHDEQHTIAVAATAMCCSDRSPTIDRDEQYVTAIAAALGYC
jgi:hypothetical protein